jgi:solute carrier family 8 (sodium/calcium exchanger)
VEAKTKLLIDFYVAEKSMAEYSAKMEPFAAKVLLGRLHKKRVNVRVMTTDRSNLLRSLLKSHNKSRMKRNLPLIKHSFDVWHYIKNVCKDLFVASKLKKCWKLGLWARSIKNMMWFSMSECQGNAELLKEMILSIPKHCSGVHNFPEHKFFKQCLHGDIPMDRSRPWIGEDSMAMRKLVTAIRGKGDSRLKDLDLMTEFQHTGTNENINSLHNKYLPKSCAFGHQQAIVRACLTAIDHNTNVGRQPARDEDGENRYNIVNSRDGQIWTAKPIMERKNYAWRQEIVDEVVQVEVRNEPPSSVLLTGS